MNNNSKWMAISGLVGFSLFLIANFTEIFVGSSVIAGWIQLCVNAFVFVTWTRGFFQSHGLKKFVAGFGVIIPMVLASITIWRVLLPAITG